MKLPTIISIIAIDLNYRNVQIIIVLKQILIITMLFSDSYVQSGLHLSYYHIIDHFNL